MFSFELYTDCAAVLDRLSKLLRRREHFEPYVYEGHDDIWSRIWWHLLQRPVLAVQPVKVKAHVQWRSITDVHLREVSRLNSLVDLDAKSSVCDHRSRIFQKCTNALNRHAEHVKHVQSVHRFWVMSCKHAIDVACLPVATQGWSMPPEASLVPQGAFFQLQPLSSDALLQAGFLFGAIFCERLCGWWNTLIWVQQSEPI